MAADRASPAAADFPAWEELLDRFDRDWQKGSVPSIEDYLRLAKPGPETGAAMFPLLAELIKLDMEYRWRSGQGAGARVEDYCRRFGGFGDALHSLEIILAEYWARRQWGDQPAHVEYLRRFPKHEAMLRKELAAMDDKLAVEFRGRQQSYSPTRTTMKNESLWQVLQAGPFLSSAQREQLARQCAAKLADSPALARELIRRAWLTPYQANQLLQGRAQDLLIGPFVILERLGEGGTGQVFKARHLRLSQVVALKLLRRDLLRDPEVIRRFQREVQLISTVNHPNVIRALDATVEAELASLSMEYVEGDDLHQLVKKQGPLPVAEACNFICQAALGLQHIHEHGLVHRDIKPSNLLITAAQNDQPRVVKILDLGLARLRGKVNGEVTSVLTPDGPTMMGTPDYLAPEQAINFHEADIRADIYSLGCVFYYALRGEPPFPAGTLAEKLLRHQQAAPPNPESFRQDVPPPVAAVLARMLAKKPEDRFQTPAAVAQALASGKVPALPRLPRLVCWLRGRWRAVTAGLLFSMLLFLTWLWLPSAAPPTKSGGSTAVLAATEAIPADLRFPGQPAELVAAFRTNGPVRHLAMSPDDRFLALSDEEKPSAFWRSAPGRSEKS